MMTSDFKPSLLSGLLVAASLYAVPAIAELDSGPAPDFTLPATTGENLRLSEQRGNVVMVNFWASWCGPCRQEMPVLDDLYKQYEPLGFTILGVNVEEDSRAAEQMLHDIPVSFPVLFDTRNEASRLYDVAAMPSTVLIDRDGNIRSLHQGYQPGYEDRYDAEIRQLVRE